MDTFSDFWLPLALALLGIGGTIIVTVVQLRARRAELNDERAARDAAELERRREAVIEAVYESVGPFVTAATVPRGARPNATPASMAAATARVSRVIRLSGRDDRIDLHEWFSLRAADWARAEREDLPALEQHMLEEIGAWFDGSATAAEIRSRAAKSL